MPLFWVFTVCEGLTHSSRYGTFFFFQPKYVNFCMETNIEYSLEVPHWSMSNEYPQHMLSHEEIRKIFLISGYSPYLHGAVSLNINPMY